MSQIQANCPHCGTLFAVPKEQLSVASGHVRCGVCLKIFKAEEHLANNSETDNSAKVANSQPNKLEEKNNSKNNSAQQKPIVERNIFGAVEAPAGDLSEDALRIDGEISDDFHSLQESEEDYSYGFEKVPVADEGIFTPLTDDKASSSNQPRKNDNLSPIDEDSFDDRSMDEIINLDESDKAKKKPSSDLSYAFDDDLFDDDDAVVHVALGEKENFGSSASGSSLKQGVFWAALSFMALLVFIAQIGFHNFELLSVKTEYREIYQSVCSVISCELPQLRDVSKVQASNIIVRPHGPQKKDLIVDAIINNTAAFNQSFPRLVLSFSDLNGKILASRSFKPSEYLNGELVQLKEMPMRSPLHISLEILNPGVDASSYRIGFTENL